jgi:hypothetical protein
VSDLFVNCAAIFIYYCTCILVNCTLFSCRSEYVCMYVCINNNNKKLLALYWLKCSTLISLNKVKIRILITIIKISVMIELSKLSEIHVLYVVLQSKTVFQSFHLPSPPTIHKVVKEMHKGEKLKRRRIET